MIIQPSHMTRWPRRLIAAFPAWLSAIAFVSACSTDGGSDAGDGSAIGFPVALESYCEEYARVTCDAAEDCFCLDGHSVDACLTVQLSACKEDVEVPADGGRMSYDSASAGACLAEIESIISDCSLEGDSFPQSCDDMLVGLLDTGKSCNDDDECRADLECIEDVCTEMPAVGQACVKDGYCASDDYCGEDQLCHVYTGLGGACSFTFECEDDLYCSAAGMCQPYRREGESCSEDLECESYDCVAERCESDDDDDDDDDDDACGLL